jgi:hypothetical protein
MPRKRPAPELFAVLPSALLRESLVQGLPEGTHGVWEQAGSLRITGRMLGAVDAGSCHPRYLPGEATQLDWPYTRAEIFLRFAQQLDGRRTRVLAVLVVPPAAEVPPDAASAERDFVDSMCVDSASAVVGDYARMQSECRAGGPLATVLVGKGTAQSAEQRQARQRAAGILKSLGLPVATSESTPYDGQAPVEFSTGLLDEQIEQARAALVAAGVTEDIWVPSAHTAVLLERQLISNLVVRYPAEGDPVLVGFHTGFGDGSYVWHELTASGQLCGYLCDFLPQEEEESDEHAADIHPEKPTMPKKSVKAARKSISTPKKTKSPGKSTKKSLPVKKKAAPAKKRASRTAAIKPSPEKLPPPTNGSPARFWPADMAPQLKPGIRVAAQVGIIKNWFMTTLVRVDGATCTVRFPAGDEMETPLASVVPFPDRPVFQVGDLVAAHLVDSPMVPGIVRTAHDDHYEVERYTTWPLHKVALGELTFQDWLVLCKSGVEWDQALPPSERSSAQIPTPAKAAPKLLPGAPVGVRGGKGKYLVARLAAVSGESYSVEYASGDHEKLKQKHLFPVPDRPVFRTGDAVLARWSGNRLCPGRITGVTRAGYAIAWDDGSGAQVVPLGSLTFREWAPE